MDPHISEMIWKFGILGAASLAGGILALQKAHLRYKSWPRAEARVEGIRPDKNRDMQLVIVFDAEGKTYRTTVGVGDSQPFGLGSAVTIGYDPVIPERTILADRKQISLAPGLLIAVGTILLGLALWLEFGNR